MIVRYKTRENGNRYTIVYDPRTNTGSQFNGHVPGGLIPHKMAAIRKQMAAVPRTGSGVVHSPLMIAGPVKPDLRIV